MIRSILLASTFALVAPAIAQTAPAPSTPPAATTPPPPTTPPAQPAPMAEAPATESTATPPADTAAPADSMAADSATPAAKPTDAQVKAVVDADWAGFDKDKSGELSKAEFGAWVTKLRSATPGAGGSASAESYNTAAFTQADADKNTRVTKAELTAFLKG